MIYYVMVLIGAGCFHASKRRPTFRTSHHRTQTRLNVFSSGRHSHVRSACARARRHLCVVSSVRVRIDDYVLFKVGVATIGDSEGEGGIPYVGVAGMWINAFDWLDRLGIAA